MNIALVVAGGSGIRTGQSVPKQYLIVDDKPVIIYTLENLDKFEVIDKVIVVISKGWENLLLSYIKQFGVKKFSGFVYGGSTRHESINNGINYIVDNFDSDDNIIIMDANRPLVPERVFVDSVNVVNSDNFVVTVPTEPCFDTMYIAGDSEYISKHIDRDTLLKGQSPECGKLSFLKKLYDDAKRAGYNNMATAEICIALGGKVKKIEGSALSFKITVKEDMMLFKAMIGTLEI